MRAARGDELATPSLACAILPGTTRWPLDAEAIKRYTAEVAALTTLVSADDLAAAQKALAIQLEVGNYAAGGGPGWTTYTSAQSS